MYILNVEKRLGPEVFIMWNRLSIWHIKRPNSHFSAMFVQPANGATPDGWRVTVTRLRPGVSNFAMNLRMALDDKVVVDVLSPHPSCG